VRQRGGEEILGNDGASPVPKKKLNASIGKGKKRRSRVISSNAGGRVIPLHRGNAPRDDMERGGRKKRREGAQIRLRKMKTRVSLGGGDTIGRKGFKSLGRKGVWKLAKD